jgi:iron complex outermembrane receptor protein
MSSASRSSLVVALAGLIGSTAASAEGPPAPATGQLESVTVTGSLLRRTDSETPSPVTVISAEDIQQSGLTTVADVVRSISADNSGSIPTAFGNGFAAGSSGVALRGLTVNSTLVLVDGRRVAAYALADDGERSFVDLNSLSLDAVERVEVLKDGGSSTYGADAIAGVVNIILKPSFTGLQASVDGGTTERGGGATRRATVLMGKGDLATDRFNAYLDLEYQKDDRILVGRRPFPFNTTDLSAIGGNNLIAGQPALFSGSTIGSVTPGTLANPGDLTSGVPNPGALAQALRACIPGTTAVTDPAQGSYCAQDLVRYTDVQPSQERIGLLGRMTVALGDHAQAYVTLGFNQNKVGIDFAPSQVQAGTPTNTNSIALPPTLASGALNPNNPFASDGQYALLNYAFGDVPNRLTETNRAYRLVGGIKGDVAGWTYDSALVVNHSSLDTEQTGLISIKGLLNAIQTGSYSFVDPASNSAAARAAVSPLASKASTTDLDSIDFRATRDLAQLPGGPLGLGLGVEARYEAQYDPSINQSLDYLGLGLSRTVGSRTVESAYAELGLPVLRTLEFSVSGRFDHYSDFGGNFAPKAGFKFKPLSVLAVRGTYTRGFRAPSFAENGSSVSEGFITYQPSDPAFIAAHGNNGYVQSYSLALYNSANPNIKPEKSDSFTFGVVFEPSSHFSATVDYYAIKKRDVIAQPAPSSALAAYFAGQPLPPGSSITLDVADPQFPNAPARPLIVSAPYTNENSLRTDGLDVELRGGLDLGSGLRLTSVLSATKIFSWKLLLSDGTSQQYVGTEGPYGLSSGAGTPRYRGSWATTLEAGKAAVTLSAYYVSGFRQIGPDAAGDACLYTNNDTGEPVPANCRVASFVDVDVKGSYDFTDRLRASLVVENVANRLPPLNPANYAAINWNPAYHQAGILGRTFRLGVDWRL